MTAPDAVPDARLASVDEVPDARLASVAEVPDARLASVAEVPGGLAEGTGDPRIDAAMIALAAAQDAPPAEQVAPLAEAHRTLRETLDSIGDV